MAHYAQVVNGVVGQVVVTDQQVIDSGMLGQGWIRMGEPTITVRWQRYFAIRPRKINGRWTWLRWAYRTGQKGHYRYGDLFDVLASSH